MRGDNKTDGPSQEAKLSKAKLAYYFLLDSFELRFRKLRFLSGLPVQVLTLPPHAL